MTVVLRMWRISSAGTTIQALLDHYAEEHDYEVFDLLESPMPGLLSCPCMKPMTAVESFWAKSQPEPSSSRQTASLEALVTSAAFAPAGHSLGSHSLSTLLLHFKGELSKACGGTCLSK